METKKILLILAVITLAFCPAGFAATSVSEDGDYEGEATTINLSTGLDGTLSDGVYTITGGVVGSDGNFTGDGTTTTLDAAPTKFILTHSSGTIYSTIGDFDQINLENDAAIDNGTNNTVTVAENSDTLSLGFDGDDFLMSFSDGSIELYPQADATEGTVDFLTGGDVNDYVNISTSSDQPLINFVGCNGKITAASGTISFDDEALSTSGSVTAGSFIVGDDTADVVVDDQFRFASNDEESTIEAYGFEAKDGVLQLTADEGDDAGDKIQLVSDQATNSLFITSDTTVKDTHATIFTLSKVGLVTTTGDIDVVNDSSTTNAVQDVLTVRSSTTGTAAAGLGVGVEFDVEDAGGIEQQGSVDVSLSTVTNGSEDADMILSLNQAGTIREVYKIDSDPDTTSTTVHEFYSWTTETNGIVDVMEIVLDNTADTATDNFGMGLSFQLEDETDAAEEQASIDIQVTDAATTAENADLIVRLNQIGTMRDVFKIDTDVTATANTTFELTSWTIETNGVVDMLELTLDNTADTATDNYGLGISFLLEDEDDAAEEQTSLDVVLTDAGSGTEDADFVFSQNVAGTVEERVRFDADSKTISAVGTTPIISVGDGGNEDNTILLDGQTTKDFYIATDNADDSFIIGVGSTVGTDSRITVQDNATETRIEIGDAVTAEDTVIVLDGNAQDFYMALDDSADDLLIGVGSTVATTPAIMIDEDQEVSVIRKKHFLDTDDVTLVEADCGSVRMIATDAKTYTLPTTITGCEYTFINTGADGAVLITVTPNDAVADGIYGTIANAAADSVMTGTDDGDLTNTKATANKGDYCTIVGDGVDGWYVIDGVGIWAGA